MTVESKITIVRTNLMKKIDPIPCFLSYVILEDSTVLTFHDENCEEIKAEGADLFDALCKLRIKLEKKDVLIICAGSVIDAYPSAMSRQMSNGKRLYRHKLGVRPSPKDIVNIFDQAEILDVGTVEEQESFMKKWYQAWRGNRGKKTE